MDILWFLWRRALRELHSGAFCGRSYLYQCIVFVSSNRSGNAATSSAQTVTRQRSRAPGAISIHSWLLFSGVICGSSAGDTSGPLFIFSIAKLDSRVNKWRLGVSRERGPRAAEASRGRPAATNANYVHVVSEIWGRLPTGAQIQLMAGAFLALLILSVGKKKYICCE
jgi:hypothetical protein